MATTPVEELAETFVELADTLVDEFDLEDFLHMLADRCVRLLEVDAAGLLLMDHYGQLRVVGASNEQARTLELLELQNDEGPSLECYRGGERVIVPDLAEEGDRWPAFTEAARAAGFAAVHTMPMRLRSEVIGALNLFRSATGVLDTVKARVGQAIADVATIGLLQERAVRRQESLAEQLQGALNSRVVIEQAKGVVSERLGIDMAGAFGALRGFARNHNLRIATVALAVLEGHIDMDELTSPPPRN